MNNHNSDPGFVPPANRAPDSQEAARPERAKLSGQERIMDMPLAKPAEVEDFYGIGGNQALLGVAEVPLNLVKQAGHKTERTTAKFYIFQDQHPDSSGAVTIIDGHSIEALRKARAAGQAVAASAIHAETLDPNQELLVGMGEPKYDRNPNYRAAFSGYLRALNPTLASRWHYTISRDEHGVVAIRDHSNNGTYVTAPKPSAAHERFDLPPRPPIGKDKDWRFISGEWRLTRLGVRQDDVPLTAHEAPIQEALQNPDKHDFYKTWLFDPGGRPRVSYTARTADGHQVRALFIVGAAHSASAKAENRISVDEYESFRDGMLKLGQGLAVFGEHLADPACTPAEAQQLIRYAAARHPASAQLAPLLNNPDVLQYVIDNVLPFGISKYHDDYEKTVYGAADVRVADGGRKERTTDDTLEEWLRAERNYSPEVSQKGRQWMLALMQSFETGSKNDGAWMASNRELVNYIDRLARSERRNFSGRGFMSPEVAKALGHLMADPDEAHKHHIHIPPAINMDEARRLRRAELARSRANIPTANPWRDLLRPL